MTPMDNELIANDPWWISLIKVVLVFLIQLLWCLFNVWYMRRLLGRMQNRKGPIMNSPGGVLQAVGDGLKLLFKETYIPRSADAIIFTLAPVISAIAAFSAWAVIPFGGEVTMFGHKTALQITDLPVAVLFLLAIASIGVYGLVLAGWSSHGPYSLLGALRTSASMISYEISMGLALVAVFMFSQSMSTSQIVAAQAQTLRFGSLDSHVPGHYWLLLIPSAIIYFISMLGEGNRPPFDMAECEQELVSGYATEYQGFRYGLYYLAEFINMCTLSAIFTTLFLGGWHAPWPFNLIAGIDAGWLGPLWFIVKTQLVISMIIWIMAAVPRFRYDQFMSIGWKWMIPISLVWIMAVALIRAGQANNWFSGPVFYIVAGAVALALLAFIFFGGNDEEPQRAAPDSEFDAFAGGYPVPPMPGQQLPELAGVVASSVAEPVAEPVPSEQKGGQA